MIATCPVDHSHDKFYTVATVLEEWVVDKNGNFDGRVDTLSVVHGPNADNIWTCVSCGAEALVENI